MIVFFIFFRSQIFTWRDSWSGNFTRLLRYVLSPLRIINNCQIAISLVSWRKTSILYGRVLPGQISSSQHLIIWVTLWLPKIFVISQVSSRSHRCIVMLNHRKSVLPHSYDEITGIDITKCVFRPMVWLPKPCFCSPRKNVQ